MKQDDMVQLHTLILMAWFLSINILTQHTKDDCTIRVVYQMVDLVILSN